MSLAAVYSPNKRTIRSLAAPAVYGVTFAVLAIAYYAIGSWLSDKGLISLDLLALAEKAHLAIYGAPPRLVNIGFIVPPLPLLLMLPFRDPMLAQAVVGAGVMTAVIAFIERTLADPWLRWTALAYVIASPLFLYLAVERYDVLLYCVLLTAGLYSVSRYLRREYSVPLFTAGLVYGVTFFVDFRSILLLPVVVLGVALPALRRSRSRAVAVALTIGVPIVFLSLSWMYVNWVFLGDALAFVNDKGSFFRVLDLDASMLASAGTIDGALRYAFSVLIPTIPITLPYVVGLVLMARGRRIDDLPVLAVYLLPLALFVFEVYAGVFVPAVSFLVLFVLAFVVNAGQMRPSRIARAALLVSLAASFVVPLVSPNREERTFTSALYGLPIDSNVADYRAMADRVAELPPGKVLLDDAVLYPVVILSGDIGRFILPYQYEYDTLAADPRAGAQYVVVAPDDAADGIATLHPSVRQGALEGFTLVYRSGPYTLFARRKAHA
jgi:hypothetical protein